MNKNKSTNSTRLASLPEYPFAILAARAKKVENTSGKKVLSFGAGIPDIRTSSRYLDAIKAGIDQEKSHYYPGYKPIEKLSNAIIAWYKNRYDLNITDKQIIHAAGAKDIVSHIPLALLDIGDEVLIPDPGYPAYIAPTLMAGGIPVYYQVEVDADGYASINLKNLKELITEKTKYMWINFPSNPTGAVANIDLYKEIIEFAHANSIYILSDAAYADITFNGYVAPSILEVDGASERAISLESLSKTFSMAGFRVGYAVGNPEIIAAIHKVKSIYDSGLSLHIQEAASVALANTDEDWQNKMIEEYERRMQIISAKLIKEGFSFASPKGSLYIWAKIPERFKDTEECVSYYLEERNILFTPGTAFGKNGEGYVRVSFCVDISEIDHYF